MAIVLVLVAIFLFPFGLALALKPREVWWTLAAWRYQNPESVEPSKDGYKLNQGFGGVLIVISVILLVVAFS